MRPGKFDLRSGHFHWKVVQNVVVFLSTDNLLHYFSVEGFKRLLILGCRKNSIAEKRADRFTAFRGESLFHSAGTRRNVDDIVRRGGRLEKRLLKIGY